MDNSTAAREESRAARDFRSTRALNRLLWRVGRHAGGWVVLLASMSLIIALAETALPAVLGRTIDGVLGRTTPGLWFTWCVLLIGVLIVGDVLEDVGSETATARSTAWLRHTGLRHLLCMPLRSADRFSAGDVAARLVGNTADAGGVAPDVVQGAAALIPAIGGTVALFLIDPWLCLTFLAGIPVLMALLWAFAKDASDLAERYLEAQGQIAGRLVHALSGARTIAAAGTTQRETQRVLAPLPDLFRHGTGMWRVQTRITTQDTLLMSLLEIAVLAVAGLELSRGRISPGELFAASQYVALGATFGSAISTLTRFIRDRAAVARVGEVLSLPLVSYGTTELSSIEGRLEFRDVTVRHGDLLSLDRVNLVVPPGALVAVVGRTGSGKSLVARLAGRLVDPDDGQVLLDGVPLPDLDRRMLRRAVGYGFERPTLIGATIAEAICFGVEEPAKADIVTASRAAHADDFIRRMPNGYQTPLREAPMSGGEVQRIGLARTFAHASQVVILDDVAASLDTVTEHEISRALTGAMANRTRILVAHRASTAARADLVVWLEEGRVREVAPHHELWRDPAYRTLFEPAPSGPNMSAAVAAVGEVP